ncbi:LPXTG cell wall anchor domain-containing protein [Pseudarthrobacter sp. NPDC058362]|uniref:LPXTG cell wall anchor domain-containing protein n=1 Tax=unclassified Pseudarthrobacter TaxID=2647000 RepID=UPI00365777FC
MKKTLAAIALAGSITFIGSPAMAGEYPPLPPAATVSDATVVVGEEFIFTAQGFLPGETVTISIALTTTGAANTGGTALSGKIPVYQAPQTLGATADAEGKIAVPLTIHEPGTYSITATGNTSGVVVGPVYVTVVAALASTGGGADLANTGADSGLILWGLVGAGALAAGATSVVVVRRRAKAEVA